MEDKYLKRLCLRNRHASEPHLKVELENTCGINISARTVHRRMTECGLFSSDPKKKQFLTQNKIKKNKFVWEKNMFYGRKLNGTYSFSWISSHLTNADPMV